MYQWSKLAKLLNVISIFSFTCFDIFYRSGNCYFLCIFSLLQDTVDIVESSVVINSILQGQVTIGPGSVVTNCYMNGHIQVGKESICSGLKMELNVNKTYFYIILCFYSSKVGFFLIKNIEERY